MLMKLKRNKYWRLDCICVLFWICVHKSCMKMLVSLKLINKDLSYRVLHATFSRATPKIFSLYQTCINYYDLIHSPFQLVIEKGNLQSVMLNNCRNTKLTFVWINQSHAGLNNIVNRLRSVTNMINKNWLQLSRDVFKSRCIQHIIQSQLILL